MLNSEKKEKGRESERECFKWTKVYSQNNNRFDYQGKRKRKGERETDRAKWIEKKQNRERKVETKTEWHIKTNRETKSYRQTYRMRGRQKRKKGEGETESE